MTFSVFPQTTFTLKRLPADFAAVRRLSRHIDVVFNRWTFLRIRLQTLRVRRTLAVLIAVDLPQVTLAVSLQGAALHEGLPAVLADVWAVPAVNLLVAPQRSGSGETFVADATAVWFDPRVASHMCLHVLETLTADAAGPISLSVRLQMSQQTVR